VGGFPAGTATGGIITFGCAVADVGKTKSAPSLSVSESVPVLFVFVFVFVFVFGLNSTAAVRSTETLIATQICP
jgi:hypothetical protein